MPPDFDIVVPPARRVTVVPATAEDTVGDLARALGAVAPTHLHIDGQVVDQHQLLAKVDVLRSGSEVALTPDAVSVPPGDRVPTDPTIEVALLCGPACSGWKALGVGRHQVGRSGSSAIVVPDPAVELHHGVLEVDSESEVRFTQLTGRVPVRIAGRPCGAREPLGPGASLIIGSSRLAFRCVPTVGEPPADSLEPRDGGSLVEVDQDPWRRRVQRGPTLNRTDSPSEISIPTDPPAVRSPPLTGLIGAAVAVFGAGMIAVLFGQLMFALFALMGAVASVATWIVGAIGAYRQRRRATRDMDDQVAEFQRALEEVHARQTDIHSGRYASIVQVLSELEADAAGAWQQRSTDGSPLAATVGMGTVHWTAPVSLTDRAQLSPLLLERLRWCEELGDVVAPITMSPGSVIALHGEPRVAIALARAVVVQLAVSSGPADWRIVVLASDPRAWSWVEWLPHCRLDDGLRAVVASVDGEAVRTVLDAARRHDGRRVVVVVDDPRLLSSRTGALRRYLSTTSACCLLVVDADSTVPASCERVLTVGQTGRAMWHGAVPDSDNATDIRLGGLDEATAQRAARKLSALLDPEDDMGAAGLAGRAQLADLDPEFGGDRVTARSIAQRWSTSGVDPAPSAPIGLSADGIVEIDLVRDGPHGLIAGTTGSGKSELLRTLVVSLAAQLGPEHLNFVLIDYKGGSTFDVCTDLPHTVGVVTDLDDGLAERALLSLDAEIKRREALIRRAGASDLAGYRQSECDTPMARLVVVIDEFAALAKELPEFLSALVALAERGRSLGIHLLLATQRPAGVVSDDIRANTNLRLALRLHDVADARDVVGDDVPTRFPRGVPGRAVLRLGPEELVEFQVARCTGAQRRTADRLQVRWDSGYSGFGSEGRDPPAPTELELFVAAIRGAAEIGCAPAPHLPWLEPLPARLAMADTASPPVVVDSSDVVDHGDGQRSRRASGARSIGIVDDPEQQARRPLQWDPSAGNLLMIGSLGSGTTTALVSLVAAHTRWVSPDECHVYVIDAKGDQMVDAIAAIGHCGCVLKLHEAERIERLIRRLHDAVGDRSAAATDPSRILLFIDGLGALRSVLGTLENVSTLAMLDRVLRDGPAVGVAVCSTTDGASSGALAAPCAQRWVFHVDDPAVARALGIRGALVSVDAAGRLRVAESGLEAQVAFDAADFSELVARVPGSGPVEVCALPEHVDPDALGRLRAPIGGISPDADPSDRSGPCVLPIGIASDGLGVAVLRLPLGDHVFIGGAALTGKSTALRQIVDAWRQVHPAGVVVEVARSEALDAGRLDAAGCRPTLVAVDDADGVADSTGEFAAILAGDHPGVTIAVAARIEAVRVGYAHWVREVTRSRCGLIMTSAGEVDGDLLGVTLPRHSTIAARPGLAWLIDGRGHRLVQVAGRLLT